MILENGIKQKQGVFGTLLGHFFSAFHTLGVICFFMGIWEFGAHFASPIILPSALEVLKRAYELLFSEQSALLMSLQRVLSAIYDKPSLRNAHTKNPLPFILHRNLPINANAIFLCHKREC